MFLEEAQYLVDTYKISEPSWAERIAGQKLLPETFDLHRLTEAVPKDATEGANFIRMEVPECLSYSAESGTWYVWNGIVHTPLTASTVPMQLIDMLGYAFKALNEVLREYIAQKSDKIMSGNTEDEAQKKLKALKASVAAATSPFDAYAKSLHSNKGVRDTLEKLSRQVAKGSDHFQDDRQWLVVRNGVIDLADYRSAGKITLLAHSAERAVYRYFDAEYREGMAGDDQSTWGRFLNSSVVDRDTVLLLQKAVGAAFSAEEKPRALFNILGAPASGKSVFLSVFNKLGQGYSVMPNNQAIQLNNGDTNFYQDALRGARFVGFSEVQGKKPLDDGFLKGVLGGDQQETRQMRQTPNVWKPQCVLFIASNMALKFNTRDEATFIKILPIPFPHSFTDTDPELKMDRELESKVLVERSGILHWVLEGMRMFWDEGLAPTAAVMASMDGNKTANSSALQFIEALIESGYLEQDVDAPVSSCLPLGKGYAMFKYWAEHQGIKHAPLKQTFNADVADFYHGKEKSGGWAFRGLKMSAYVQAKIQENLHLSSMMRDL